MPKLTVASSPTIPGLERLINDYFYSTSYRIVDMKVYNSNGIFENGVIEIVKGRYKFSLVK